MTRVIALTVVLGSVLTFGCADNSQNSTSPGVAQPAAANEERQAKTNAEELGLHVKMPYETEDIAWKLYPTSKRILAAMRLSPADADRAVNDAASAGEPVTVLAEPWFPDELTAQSEMSGDSALKGTAYPATAYFQPPYNSGKVIRINGTDYIILDVTAQ